MGIQLEAGDLRTFRVVVVGGDADNIKGTERASSERTFLLHRTHASSKRRRCKKPSLRQWSKEYSPISRNLCLGTDPRSVFTCRKRQSVSDASNQEVLPTRQGILSLAGDPYMTSSNLWDFNHLSEIHTTSQLPLSLYLYMEAPPHLMQTSYKQPSTCMDRAAVP